MAPAVSISHYRSIELITWLQVVTTFDIYADTPACGTPTTLQSSRSRFSYFVAVAVASSICVYDNGALFGLIKFKKNTCRILHM